MSKHNKKNKKNARTHIPTASATNAKGKECKGKKTAAQLYCTIRHFALIIKGVNPTLSVHDNVLQNFAAPCKSSVCKGLQLFSC